MTEINWQHAEEQFGLLPLREQMLILERFHRKMRESAYPNIDPGDADRVFDELANDPAIQRELRLLDPGSKVTSAKETA